MAAAKPKVKRMMFGGAAKGVAASMQGSAKQAAASKTAPKQMQFMSDKLRGASLTGPLGSAGKPSATPPAGLNVAGIKKASAGLGDTFPRKTEPSLNEMRNAIEDTRRGKTIAGPMGTQLQAVANSVLKGGSSVGSQRALPAKPMKRGGAVKKKATKK